MSRTKKGISEQFKLTDNNHEQTTTKIETTESVKLKVMNIDFQLMMNIFQFTAYDS